MSETVETVEDAEQGAKRGRPRPEEVVQRDEQVYEAVVGSLTRKQVAEATGIKESHVYLSLLRLRNAGRLQHERTGTGHTWSRVPEDAVAE